MASKREVRRIPAQQASLHPLHQPLPKVNSGRPLSGSSAQEDKEEGGDPFAKLLKFPTEFIEKKKREEFKKKDLIHGLSGSTCQSPFAKEDARSNHPLLRPSSSAPVPVVKSPSLSPYSFPQLLPDALSSHQLRPAVSFFSTGAPAPSSVLPFSSSSHCSSLSQPLSGFHPYTSGCPPVSSTLHSDQQHLSPSPCAGASVRCSSSAWSSPSFAPFPSASPSSPICLTTHAPSKPSSFPFASSPHYSSYPALPPRPLPNFTPSSLSSSPSTSPHASSATDKAPVSLLSQEVKTTKETHPQVPQTAQKEKGDEKLNLNHSRTFLDLDTSAFLRPTNKTSSKEMCDDHSEKLLGKEELTRQISFGSIALPDKTANRNSKRIQREGSTQESTAASVDSKKQGDDSLSEILTKATFDEPFVAGSLSPFAKESLEREGHVNSFLHGGISSSMKDMVAKREEGRQYTSSFWPVGSGEDEDEKEEEGKTRGRRESDGNKSDEDKTRGMRNSSRGKSSGDPAAVESCFPACEKDDEKSLDNNTTEVSSQTPFFFPVDWDTPPVFPTSSSSFSSSQGRSSSSCSSHSSSSSAEKKHFISGGAISSEFSSVSSPSSSSVWTTESSSYSSLSTLPSSNSSSFSSALHSTSSFSMLSRASSTFPSSPLFPSSPPSSGNLLSSSSSCSIHPLRSPPTSQESLPLPTEDVLQSSKERVERKKNTCQLLNSTDELSLFGLPPSQTGRSYLREDSTVLVGGRRLQFEEKEEENDNDEKADKEKQHTPSDTNLRSLSASSDTISHPLLVSSEKKRDEGPRVKKDRPQMMKLFNGELRREQARHLFPEGPPRCGLSNEETQNCERAKTLEKNLGTHTQTTKKDVWIDGRTMKQNETGDEEGYRQRKEKGKEENFSRPAQSCTTKHTKLDLASPSPFSFSSCQDRAPSSSIGVANCGKEAPISCDSRRMQNGHICRAFVEDFKKREEHIPPLESPETGEHVWNEEKETGRHTDQQKGGSWTEEKENKRTCRDSKGEKAEEKNEGQQNTSSSLPSSSFLFPIDALVSLEGKTKKDTPRCSSPSLRTLEENGSKGRESLDTNEGTTFFFLTSTPKGPAEEGRKELKQSSEKAIKAECEQNTSAGEKKANFSEAKFACTWEVNNEEDGQHASAKKQGKKKSGEADNSSNEKKSSLFFEEAPNFLLFSSSSPLWDVEGKEGASGKQGMRQEEQDKEEEEKQLPSGLSRGILNGERGGKGGLPGAEGTRETKNEESLRNMADGGEAESERERGQENLGGSVVTFPPHSVMAATGDRFACFFDVFETTDNKSTICPLPSPSSPPPASSSLPSCSASPRPSSSLPSSCLVSPFPGATAPSSLGTCCALKAEEKSEVASSIPFLQTSLPGQTSKTAEELSKNLFAFFEQDDSDAISRPVVLTPHALEKEEQETSGSSQKQTLSCRAHSSFSPPGPLSSLVSPSSPLRTRSLLPDQTPGASCSPQKKKTDMKTTSPSSPFNSLPFPSLLPPPPPPAPLHSSFAPSSSLEEKNLLLSENSSSSSPCTPRCSNISPSPVHPPSYSVPSLPQEILLTSPRESSALVASPSSLSRLSSNAASALAALVSADAAFERLKLKLREEEGTEEDKRKEGGVPVQESAFDVFFSTPVDNKATLSSSVGEEDVLFPSLQLTDDKHEREEAVMSDKNRTVRSNTCLSTSAGRKEKKEKEEQHTERERGLKDSFPFSEWSSSHSRVSRTPAKELEFDTALSLSPSRCSLIENDEIKGTELRLASQSYQRIEAIIPTNRDPGNVREVSTHISDFVDHRTSFCFENSQQKTSSRDTGDVMNKEAPSPTAIPNTQRVSSEDFKSTQDEKQISQGVCTPDSSKALSDTERERFPLSHSTSSSCVKREILGAEEAMVAALAIEIASPEMVLASSASEQIERVVKKQERSEWERGDDNKDDEDDSSTLTPLQTRREEELKASSETSCSGARSLLGDTDWRSGDHTKQSDDSPVTCEREDNRQRGEERERESDVTKEDLEDIFETCICRPAETHTSSFLPRPEEVILDEILTHQSEENRETRETMLVSSSPVLLSPDLMNSCTSAETSNGLSSFPELEASSYVRGAPEESFPETQTRRDKDAHSFENQSKEDHRVWREEDTPDCWIHMSAKPTRKRETENEGETDNEGENTQKEDDELIHITRGGIKSSFHMKRSEKQFLREVDESKEEDVERRTDTKDKTAMIVNEKTATAKTGGVFFVRKRDLEVGDNQHSQNREVSPLENINDKEERFLPWISSFSAPLERKEEKEKHTQEEANEVREREENLSWAIFPPSPALDVPPLEENQKCLISSREKQNGDTVHDEGSKDVSLRQVATRDENWGLLSFQEMKSPFQAERNVSPAGLHDTPSKPSSQMKKEDVLTRLSPSIEWRERIAQHEKTGRDGADEERNGDLACQDDGGKTTGCVGETTDGGISDEALKTRDNEDLLTTGKTLKTEEQNKDIVLLPRRNRNTDDFLMDCTEFGEWESASCFQQCKEEEDEEVREKKEGRSCCDISYSTTEEAKSREKERKTWQEKSERHEDSGGSFWPEENLFEKRSKEVNKNEIIWPREVDVNPFSVNEECWMKPCPQEEYTTINTLAQKSNTEDNMSLQEGWEFSTFPHSGTQERKTPFSPRSGVCTPEGGLKETKLINADDPFDEGSGGIRSSPFSETPPDFFEITFSSSLSSSPIQYSGADKQLTVGKDHVPGVHTSQQNKDGFSSLFLPTSSDHPLYPTRALSSSLFIGENLFQNSENQSLGKVTLELLEAERNERGAEDGTQANKIPSSDKVPIGTKSLLSKWNGPESQERDEENHTGSAGWVFEERRIREKEGEEAPTAAVWQGREEDRRKDEDQTDEEKKRQVGELVQNQSELVEQHVCQVSRDDEKDEDSYEEKQETNTQDLHKDETSLSSLTVSVEKTGSILNEGDARKNKDYDTLSKMSSTPCSLPLLLLGPPSPEPSIPLGLCSLSSSLPSISSAFLCSNSPPEAPASSGLLPSSHPSFTLESDLSSPASASILHFSTFPAVASLPSLHSKDEVDPKHSQTHSHGVSHSKHSVHSTVPASSETSRIPSSSFSSSLVSPHSSSSSPLWSPTEMATATPGPPETSETRDDLSCLLLLKEKLCQPEPLSAFSEKERDLKENKCQKSPVTSPDTTVSLPIKTHRALSSEAKHNPLFLHSTHETTDEGQRNQERENTHSILTLPAAESSPFLLVRGVDESRDTVGVQPFERRGEREKRRSGHVFMERRTSSLVELAEKEKNEKESESELSNSSSSLLPLCPPLSPTSSVVSLHCHGMDERRGVASRKNEDRRGRSFLSSSTPLVRSPREDGSTLSTRNEDNDVNSAETLSSGNSLFVSSFSPCCCVSISPLSPSSSLKTRGNTLPKHEEDDDARLQKPSRAERNDGEEKLGSTAGGTPGDLCQSLGFLQTEDTVTTLRNLSSGEDQADSMKKSADPLEEVFSFPLTSASFSFSSPPFPAARRCGPVDNAGVQEEDRSSKLGNQLSRKPAAEVELCTRKHSPFLLSSFPSSLFAGRSSPSTNCNDKQLNRIPIITDAPASQDCLPLFPSGQESQTEEEKKAKILEPFSLNRATKVLREDGKKTGSLPCCRVRDPQETGARGKALALHGEDTRQDCVAGSSLIEGDQIEGRGDAPPLIVKSSEDKVKTPFLRGAIEEEERKKGDSAAGGGTAGEAEMMATSISSLGKKIETGTEDDELWLMIEKGNYER